VVYEGENKVGELRDEVRSVLRKRLVVEKGSPEVGLNNMGELSERRK
jgi:hypothetical protein